MASDTSLAGLAVPFEWGGRTFWLGAKSYDLFLAFQQYQEGNARRRILAHRREMGEEEYAEQMAGWRRDLAANAYAFGSAPSWQFLWTQQGFREYAWLKLKKGEQERGGLADEPVTREDLDAMLEDEQARADLRLLVTEMDFPKAMTPEGALEAARLRQRRRIGSGPRPSSEGAGAA